MMTSYTRHSNAINEGGYGYNPYEAEMLRSAEASWEAEWTLETTVARRAQWNDFARSLAGKVAMADVAAAEKRLGFTVENLRRAIRHHGL